MLLGMVVIIAAVILVTSSKLRSGKMQTRREMSGCEAGAD